MAPQALLGHRNYNYSTLHHGGASVGRGSLSRALARWAALAIVVCSTIYLCGRFLGGAKIEETTRGSPSDSISASDTIGKVVQQRPLVLEQQPAGGSSWLKYAAEIDFVPVLEFDPRTEITHVSGKHALTADAAYMINLAWRKDRRETGSALAKLLGIDLSIAQASTVKSAEVVARSMLVHDDRMGGIWPLGSHVSLVEIACWASHARIWETAAARNLSSVLVLEDDVDIEYDTLQILQPLSDLWPTKGDILYLGHCDNPAGTLIATSVAQKSGIEYNLHEATHPSCTTAYIATQRGIQILRDNLQVPTEAIDDLIVALHKTGQLKVLSMHPPLAVQRQVSVTNPSDITNDSGFLHRMKLVGNYAWEKFRGVRRDNLYHSAVARTPQIIKQKSK